MGDSGDLLFESFEDDGCGTFVGVDYDGAEEGIFELRFTRGIGSRIRIASEMRFWKIERLGI